MTECQIIDAQGRFVGALTNDVSDASISSYLVVSVVGCQSGGKSTLLNTAFGTSFPVLDAPKSGRRRTTLGVWGAVAECTPPVVVLDVEGTDSRERGEGAVAFQARTAMLALALSDVVLVNMWAHDVGRHSAANYDLFETVFAHAASLRKGDSPVRLVVVVRDCEPDAPVHDISRVLTGDLRNIWASLKKPDKLFNQLFSLRVVAMPHKKYAPEKFSSEVKEMGKSIINNRDQQFRQPVPLTGFDTFSREVWLSICHKTGGDGPDAAFTLDLPRHVALTAHYKCGEVLTGVFNGPVGVRLEELLAEIELNWNKPISDFGSRIDDIARDAFSQYDTETRAYQGAKLAGDALGQRRRELGAKLVGILMERRERYLWVCREFCRKNFEDEFRPMLGGTNGFERNAKRLANSFVKRYRHLLEGSRLPSSLDEFILANEAERKKEESASDSDTAGGASAGIQILDTEQAFQELSDNSDDEGDDDEYSVEAFKKDLFRLVEERRRLGEIMLPGGGNLVAAVPKPEPWWKGLLIRGAILLINYLQATQGQRAALKLQRKHEKEFPPGPTF